MIITDWRRAIETLSEKMPDPVTTIKASEHTLRMLSMNGWGGWDPESTKADLDKGIRGYYWGKTFMVDPSLKHGVFVYYDGETPKGTLDFSMYPDGAYNDAAIIQA